MRITAKKTLREFWQIHNDCEQSLKSWYKEAFEATWASPRDIKNKYPSASFLAENRVVFNIKGNKYRLVVKINYDFSLVWIRFVGTHAEYDKINAQITKLMILKILKTKEDYEAALIRLEVIFDSKKGADTADELELLSLLIENYENQQYPIDLPDPIEAIKFRMNQLGFKQKDLAKALGQKSRVSEVLNKKRKLSIEMIRKLHETLGIPSEVLIRDY